jgi:hypothetical protein
MKAAAMMAPTYVDIGKQRVGVHLMLLVLRLLLPPQCLLATAVCILSIALPQDSLSRYLYKYCSSSSSSTLEPRDSLLTWMSCKHKCSSSRAPDCNVCAESNVRAVFACCYTQSSTCTCMQPVEQSYKPDTRANSCWFGCLSCYCCCCCICRCCIGTSSP